jgi:hypothetical protein
VYCPPWVEWSAGIRVLHYLCHELNEASFEAYLAIHGPIKGDDSNVNLNTPVLSEQLVRKHLLEGKRAIAIYPESVLGNPLGATHSIRWILNFPTLLGGRSEFSDDIIMAYSLAIAIEYKETSGSAVEVLFIPALDVSEIDECVSKKFDSGDYDVVYAQKYRALSGKVIKNDFLTREIQRFGASSTTRKQTLELISNARKIHVYENSTVITEAALLGVPVCCHANAYFSRLIAEFELGVEGISWDHESTAKINPQLARKKYLSAQKESRSRLSQIFGNLEFNAPSSPTFGPIKLPRRGYLSKHGFDRARVVYKTKGLRVLLNFVRNYVCRGQSRL